MLWIAPVRDIWYDHGCNASQLLYNVLCVVQPPHMRVARRQEFYMREASQRALAMLAAASPSPLQIAQRKKAAYPNPHGNTSTPEVWTEP